MVLFGAATMGRTFGYPYWIRRPRSFHCWSTRAGEGAVDVYSKRGRTAHSYDRTDHWLWETCDQFDHWPADLCTSRV